MSKVIADMTMSLDGYVADPDDGIDRLFGWFGNGDVATPTASPEMTFLTSEASAGVLRGALAEIGALVVGRRLYDLAGAWGGNHAMGAPVVVVTHTPPDEPAPEGKTPFTFVTDGVEAAVAEARKVAGGKNVVVASANVAQQCLDAGLLDEVSINLVPILLGAGVPYFADLTTAPVTFGDPHVIEGTGVTHLRYPVTKA
jgi:dihydrofolate reductase